MNIDERLERHEALTQAVEIIAGMQRENERQAWAGVRRYRQTRS
jgi:hypothetical protein